ncbi:hypothetical protein AEAC466_13690 [Asticcacaulis sp. AC466]|uniref:hypothetical protein n=1 Tax=Asticcacaulis sp. AC466 TaxID=1282362 RepID=UPI0003C3DB14|nr:hypothetical protein [Asticcacaulis sp. AC466]ESQ83299.1 hypothetical protein AEAC466_13690 [Asticcacaulis sp. AC466]
MTQGRATDQKTIAQNGRLPNTKARRNFTARIMNPSVVYRFDFGQIAAICRWQSEALSAVHRTYQDTAK